MYYIRIRLYLFKGIEMKNVTGSIAIFIGLLFIVGCNKISPNAQLDNATQEYNAKNYNTAIIQLKNLIRDEPANKNARLLMANSQYQLGNFLDAEKEYTKAIELGVTNDNVAHFYTNTLYALDDYVGVTRYWEDASLQLSPENQTKLAPVVSLAYLNQTKSQESFDTAQTGKEQAIELAIPELVTINTAIANSFKQPTDIKTTIKELSTACESYPDRWIVCNLLANALFSEQRFSEAAEILEGILSKKPNHTLLVVKLADSYVKAENDEKAELYVNALLKLYPSQPYVNLLAATLELKKENFESALNHINSTLNSGLTSPQAKLVASIAHYHLGNDEQALYNLQSLKLAFPDNPLITKLYVALQLRLGNTDSLGEAYSQATPSEVNSELFALASLELLKTGAAEKTTELLQKIDTSLIKNQKILNSVSLIKLASGDNSGIKDLEASLNTLIANQADKKEISKVKMLLISSLVANKELTKAEEYVNTWAIKSPNDIENKFLLIEIEKKQADIDQNKIIKLYNDILALAPNNELANIYFARDSFINQNFEKALSAFNKVLEVNKFNFSALQGYLLSQEKLNKLSEALPKLEKLYSNYEKNMQERLMLAQSYLLVKQPEQAIKLLQGVNSPEHDTKLKLLIAEAYMQNKTYERAIDVYEEQLAKGAPNKRLIERLALALEKSGNIKASVAAFEKLKQANPDNTQIGLILANFHLFDNKALETISYIESLSAEQQQHPIVQGIKGKAYYFSKQYVKALPLLTESFNKTANGKLISFIFESKLKLNQVDDALADMEKYFADNPNDKANRIYYANELNKHDKNKAMAQYEEIIAYDSTNLIALNNFAWLLYESGDFTEAKKYIEQAKKIAPNHPAIVDTDNKIKQALNK
jgi:putative PEP-CTERM system TPR-repeat lipoprotein